MKIEEINLTKLVPYARNPRINDEAVAGIAASIKEFGFQNPIILDKENVIIAGHTRLKAAQHLGLKSVPCIRAENLTPDQVRAYRILDNKLAERATWDPELLPIELSEIELDLTPFDVNFDDVLSSGNGEVIEDEPVEPKPDAQTDLGDVWDCGGHVVCCDDSDKREPLITGGLMVTDPPYGVKYDPGWRTKLATQKGRTSEGKVENDDRIDWSPVIANYAPQVCYVWHEACQTSIMAIGLQSVGYDLISSIIWVKQRFVFSRGDYHWQHEPCWYAVKKGANHNWQGARDQSTIWQIANNNAFTGGNEEKFGHGTQKPVECMARPIRNNSKKGDTVSDPFLGSGTTLIAAEQLGRQCFGVEISPQYVDATLERFYRLTGKIPTRQNDGAKYKPR